MSYTIEFVKYYLKYFIFLLILLTIRTFVPIIIDVLLIRGGNTDE